MRPAPAALEAWIAEAGELAMSSEPVLVPVEDERLFLTTYGICRQSIRYAQAYVATVHAGFAHEAAPLSRAAFEHAVTAQWCLLTPGGHALVAAGVWAGTFELARAVAQRAGDQEWLDEIEAAAPSRHHGRPSFTKMMKSVDHEDFLALIYALLSQGVHVTTGAVTGFLVADDDHDDVSLLDARRELDDVHYQVLHAAAMSALLALSVLAHVSEDQDLLDIVSQRSDELMLPWLLGTGERPGREGSG